MVDDANLIAGCLDRDPGAVRQLVDRYQHLVYTVAMRVLRDPMDAEESAQDSFIKALDKLHTFDGRGRFSTWLFSIAHRTAISKLRSRKRTGSLDEISDTSAEPMESPTTPDERREQLDRAIASIEEELHWRLAVLRELGKLVEAHSRPSATASRTTLSGKCGHLVASTFPRSSTACRISAGLSASHWVRAQNPCRTSDW